MKQDKGKPPLGIVPEAIWRMKRLEQLLDALARYRADNRAIYEGLQLEWARELGRHADWIKVHGLHDADQ